MLYISTYHPAYINPTAGHRSSLPMRDFGLYYSRGPSGDWEPHTNQIALQRYAGRLTMISFTKKLMIITHKLKKTREMRAQFRTHDSRRERRQVK